jgi:TolA-binding protein
MIVITALSTALSYLMYLTQMVNTRKGKIITQQQTEMNPPNPPPVETEQVIATQRLVIQQLTDMMTKMQNQIRQEREEIRQARLEIQQEIRQSRLERQEQPPSPPPPAPPSYINIYINYYYL